MGPGGQGARDNKISIRLLIGRNFYINSVAFCWTLWGARWYEGGSELRFLLRRVGWLSARDVESCKMSVTSYNICDALEICRNEKSAGLDIMPLDNYIRMPNSSVRIPYMSPTSGSRTEESPCLRTSWGGLMLFRKDPNMGNISYKSRPVTLLHALY